VNLTLIRLTELGVCKPIAKVTLSQAS